MRANTTVISTDVLIGDGGTGCVDPVSGGADTIEVIAREGVQCGIEGFGGLR